MHIAQYQHHNGFLSILVHICDYIPGYQTTDVNIWVITLVVVIVSRGTGYNTKDKDASLYGHSKIKFSPVYSHEHMPWREKIMALQIHTKKQKAQLQGNHQFFLKDLLHPG